MPRLILFSICLLAGCANSPSGDVAQTGGANEPGGSGGTAPDSHPTGDRGPSAPHLLVFTHTAGFRHASIEAGVTLLNSLANDEGWAFTHSEEPTVFNDQNLAPISCVVFLNTTGDILSDTEQSAFEKWFTAQGAFVGVHAATDTEYGWPFYSQLVGATFKSHPTIQRAQLKVEDNTHPATNHLSSTWARTDEWYDFVESPRPNVHVLLTLDEASYEGGTMGADHPIAWFQELASGRSFYTALGHTEESYAESNFIEHLRGGLRWVHHLKD